MKFNSFFFFSIQLRIHFLCYNEKSLKSETEMLQMPTTYKEVFKLFPHVYSPCIKNTQY